MEHLVVLFVKTRQLSGIHALYWFLSEWEVVMRQHAIAINIRGLDAEFQHHYWTRMANGRLHIFDNTWTKQWSDYDAST